MGPEEIRRLLAVAHTVSEVCLTELRLYREEDVALNPTMLFETTILLEQQKRMEKACGMLDEA